MDELDDLTEIERLLLMAAAVHGRGPNTNISTTAGATAPIVHQALRWLGVSADQLYLGWREPEKQPINGKVYNVLIRMTRQAIRGGSWRAAERPGAALFEGSGNWGVPGDPDHPAALPAFNTCRLTVHGERIARKLLERYPDYRKDD